MSKILITGAAGFIGSQLAYKFIKEGHKLILVDNMSYGHEDNLKFDDVDLNEVLFKYDIRDREKMEEIFNIFDDHFDYVIVNQIHVKLLMLMLMDLLIYWSFLEYMELRQLFKHQQMQCMKIVQHFQHLNMIFHYLH